MAESIVESSTEAVLNVSKTERIRVLHVDDELGLLKVAKQCLEMQGEIEVDTVSSVNEASEKLKKTDYDAIVCDYQMPGKDGLEFLKELRTNGNNAPFIVFTGKGREEIAVKALNLGADQYVDKHGDPETVYCELAHSIKTASRKKKAEDAKRGSEERYRTLLESISDSVYVLDREWRHVIVNEAAANFTRTPREKLLGNKLTDLFPGVEKTPFFAAFKRVMETRKPETVSGKYVFEDGREGWYEVHVYPVPEGILCMSTDITNRKKTEEELKVSEEKLQNVFAASPDAITVTDLNGNMVECNQETVALHGYVSKEELIGKNSLELIAKKDHKRAIEGLKETLEHGSTKNLEYTFLTKGGCEFPAELSASVVRDASGKPEYLMAITKDITERKKVEEEMRKSEVILQNITDSVIVTDLEGRITSWNEGASRIFGFSAEEMLGETIAKTCKPKEREQVAPAQLEQVRKGVLFSGEWEGVRKDGESVWLMLTTKLLKNSQGETVGMIGVGKDITERKKAEEALRETKDYLDNLLNYANAPIIVWDNEQKIALFNNAFEALTGYKKESMLGRNIDVLFPPLQKTEILQTIERATRGEKWQSVEVPILCKDEETRTVLWNSANVANKDGNIVATIAQGQDITERKALEDALKDTKQKWTSLTENTDDIVLIVDSEGIIQYINRTIPPYTPEETIGKTVYEYVPREQHDTMRSSLKKTFETGVPLNYVVSSNIPKIGTIWFKTKIVPVKDDEKTVSAILMTTDITELKNIGERLKETNMKLVVTNEKLHVVGGLTRHDVRNKLSAVTGNAYLLKRKLAEDPEALGQLTDMEAAVRLVERIFEFARVYERLGVEQLASMDVGKTVDGAVSLFSDLKGVKIVNECDGLTVLADSLLRQLFYNLVDNSLKYGEKIQQIKIHYRMPSADQVELIYEDDGVGIPDNMRSNLFKEGFTSGKGTGYGLFMTKRICEVYGWTILETGKQGKGAQFTMSIPRIGSTEKGNYQVQKTQQRQQESATNMEVPNAHSQPHS